LQEFSQRFLAWVDDVSLEEKTKKPYYHNGWRLLGATAVVNVRLDEIAGDCIDRLKCL